MRIRLCTLVALASLSLSPPTAYACADKLLESEAGHAKIWERLRQKFIKASSTYAAKYPTRRFSLFRGNEYPLLKLETFAANSHAFYIATGGDLYRLLVDFPSVEHYHFLDTWRGWGESPAHVIATLKHRLDQFAGNLTIEQMGFAATHLSKPTLDLNQAGQYLDAIEAASQVSGQDTRPLIIKFEVKVPGSHLRAEKRIWIHPFDFSSRVDFPNLLASIPASEPIVGVLLAGLTGNPYADHLNALLDRMLPGGAYIKEFAAFEFESYMQDQAIALPKLHSDFSEYLNTDQITVELTPVTDTFAAEGGIPKATVMLLRKKAN